MNAAERKVYAAVALRAAGLCEACGRNCAAEDGHRDHFFGRKHGTTVESTWLLCVECDHRKTNSLPTAASWCRRFIAHAVRHGYAAEAARAETKIVVLVAKGLAS